MASVHNFAGESSKYERTVARTLRRFLPKSEWAKTGMCTCLSLSLSMCIYIHTCTQITALTSHTHVTPWHVYTYTYTIYIYMNDRCRCPLPRKTAPGASRRDSRLCYHLFITKHKFREPANIGCCFTASPPAATGLLTRSAGAATVDPHPLQQHRSPGTQQGSL